MDNVITVCMETQSFVSTYLLMLSIYTSTHVEHLYIYPSICMLTPVL